MREIEKEARELVLQWLFKAYPNLTDYEAPPFLTEIITEALTQSEKRGFERKQTDLEAENKRLREALTKYSDRNNWKDGTINGFNCYENIFVLDGYKGWFLARQALGGEV